MQKMPLTNLLSKIIAKEYARKQHFKNLRFLVDDGYSGTSFDRPSFREMEQLIESGEVGTVIVKDMSRLGRNYLQVDVYGYCIALDGRLGMQNRTKKTA